MIGSERKGAPVENGRLVEKGRHVGRTGGGDDALTSEESAEARGALSRRERIWAEVWR